MNVSIKLFYLSFVPLLAQNPGDATPLAGCNSMGRYRTRYSL